MIAIVEHHGHWLRKKGANTIKWEKELHDLTESSDCTKVADKIDSDKYPCTGAQYYDKCFKRFTRICQYTQSEESPWVSTEMPSTRSTKRNPLPGLENATKKL